MSDDDPPPARGVHSERLPVARRRVDAAAEDRRPPRHRWTVVADHLSGQSPQRVSIQRASRWIHALAAAAAVGIDLAGHRPRRVDAAVSSQPTVLISCSSRHKPQLRLVVGIDPACWSRAFTLKELTPARRRGRVAFSGGSVFDGWLRRVAEGRGTAELMTPTRRTTSPIPTVCPDDITSPWWPSCRERSMCSCNVARGSSGQVSPTIARTAVVCRARSMGREHVILDVVQRRAPAVRGRVQLGDDPRLENVGFISLHLGRCVEQHRYCSRSKGSGSRSH